MSRHVQNEFKLIWNNKHVKKQSILRKLFFQWYLLKFFNIKIKIPKVVIMNLESLKFILALLKNYNFGL